MLVRLRTIFAVAAVLSSQQHTGIVYGGGDWPHLFSYQRGELLENGNYLEPEGISVRHGICGDPEQVGCNLSFVPGEEGILSLFIPRPLNLNCSLLPSSSEMSRLPVLLHLPLRSGKTPPHV